MLHYAKLIFFKISLEILFNFQIQSLLFAILII